MKLLYAPFLIISKYSLPCQGRLFKMLFLFPGCGRRGFSRGHAVYFKGLNGPLRLAVVVLVPIQGKIFHGGGNADLAALVLARLYGILRFLDLKMVPDFERQGKFSGRRFADIHRYFISALE